MHLFETFISLGNFTYFLAFHGCVGGVLGKFCQAEGLLAGILACFELFGHNNPQSGAGLVL
jgi:hypothetical protein